MRVLGVFKNMEDAVKVWREYMYETGFYATIWKRVSIKDGSREVSYEVRAYDEPCLLGKYVKLEHMDLRLLAAEYLRARKYVQQSKQILREMPVSSAVREILETGRGEKESIVREAERLIQAHPIAKWCSIVKAGRGSLGAAAALIYIGYIDPHECTTAGKAFKYWGLTPEGKKRRGVRSVGRMDLKGVAIFNAKRVVMGNDPYYKPVRDAKKRYYLGVLPTDLKGRKAVANDKANYWLAKILLGNAWELYRRSENLKVHKHRNHIPPKSYPGQKPDPQILERIELGELE